tara:strand:+ start:1271 stop:1834 length:564 start_codon:yes stop_codon:yes gene_type:complete
MAYTAKQVGSVVEVERDSIHVATYDPVSEETKILSDDFEKFSNHIGRAVKDFIDDTVREKVEEDAHVDPDTTRTSTAWRPSNNQSTPEEETPEEAPTTLQSDLASLKSQLQNERAENARLRERIQKLEGKSKDRKSTPERFSDPVDLTDAPPQDPTLGDLTPAFIEWARKNFNKDVFKRRYNNRIKK